MISIALISFYAIPQQADAEDTTWRKGNNAVVLPVYCQDRLKAGGKSTKKYPQLRDVWIHIHHYCGGIYAQIKAKSETDRRKRAHWLREIRTQMKYVSPHCGVRCVLYPELHSRWGWALHESGDTAEAIRHLMLAIQAKPSYSTAYALLADLYVEIDQPDEARKILQQGLEYRPKSKKLKRRLGKLAP